MGSNQSQPSPPEDQTPIQIDRSEIPEAFGSVRVTRGVLHRLNSDDRLDAATLPQKSAAQPQQPSAALVQQQPTTVSVENIEEAKRVFRDTVDKVEKQFFNYHRENACADNEKEVLDCLAANTNQVLKCDSLWAPYNRCIGDFHAAVLREKSEAPAPSTLPQQAKA